MNRDETMDYDAHWRFDKKVPVTLLAGMVVQVAVGIWYASNVNTRMDVLEHQFQAAAVIADRQAQSASGNFERLIKVEAKVDSIGGTLAEIKQLIRPPRPAQ